MPSSAPLHFGRRLRLAGPLGPWMGNVAAPLAAPQFRRLWLFTCASNLLRWMELTITSWIALQLTGSPWLVALAGVCRAAPLPLVGPFSGMLADRYDRVLLVRFAQWGKLVPLALLTGTFLTGHGAYWQLLVVSVWLGVSWSLEWPSRRSLLGDLVGPELLLRAAVLDNATMAGTRVIGPLLAGILLAMWGSAAYGAVVLLPVLALVALSQLATRRDIQPAQATSVWQQLRGGFAYVRREQTIWAVILITVAMNFFIFPSQQLFSVVAEHVLRVGPVQLGWMGAANGLGATLGLLFLPRVSRIGGRGWVFAGGSIVAAVALGLFAGSTTLWLSLVLLVLSGFGHTGFSVMQATLVLSHATPEMRGRAMGVMTLAIGSSPLGNLEQGLIAEQWGAPVAIGSSALLCAVIVTLVAWWSPRLLRPRPTPQPAPAR
ncbi:MAG: hypothetical protein CL878_15555 [Dehalococcoidia bacterium]|nr:hypothetical protein [Dehalococcoidia bacterium]